MNKLTWTKIENCSQQETNLNFEQVKEIVYLDTANKSSLLVMTSSAFTTFHSLSGMDIYALTLKLHYAVVGQIIGNAL